MNYIRILILSVLSTLCASIGYGAITQIPGESGLNSTGATPVSSLALTKTFVAGHTLIVRSDSSVAGTVTSITSTNGNTFTAVNTAPILSPTVSSGAQYNFWIVKNTTAGADTITVNYGVASAFASIAVTSFSGADTVNPYDVGDFTFTLMTGIGTFSGTPVVTTTANDVIYVSWNMYALGGTAYTAGWTGLNIDTNTGGGDAYKLTTTAGSYVGQVDTTQNQNMDFFTLTLKPASILPPPGPISSIVNTSSATTVTSTWSTSPVGNTQMACGTAHLGPYTLTGVENNTVSNVTSHHNIVTGLTPSNSYYCILTSATSGGSVSSTEQLIVTTAALATTPILGVTQVRTTGTDGLLQNMFGTRYNDQYPTHYQVGDSFYNTKCADGNTYMIGNDTYGFDFPVDGSGVPTGTVSSVMITTFNGTPPIGATLNTLSSFGLHFGSWKGFGLVCPNDFYNTDSLYLFTSWQTYTNPEGNHAGSNFNRSNDHGVTWAGWEAPTVFNANGSAPISDTSNFFGGTNNPIVSGTSVFSVITPVLYLPGNLDTNPLVDQQNAYLYFIAAGAVAGDSYFTNGNNTFLLRVPRAFFGDMDSSKWQWYTGGGADGNLNSSWSSSSAGATSVFTLAGYTGWESMQWLPTVNRYLLTTTTYPRGAAVVTTAEVRWYEGPKPWGPWTQVFRAYNYNQGWFSSIPLQSSISNFSANNTLRILVTGNYTTYGDPVQTSQYSLSYSDFKLETAFTKPLQYTWGISPNQITLRGGLGIYDFSNVGNILADRGFGGKDVTITNTQNATVTGNWFTTTASYTLPFGTDYFNTAGITDATVAVAWKQQDSGAMTANSTLIGKSNAANNAIDFALRRNGGGNSMSITVLGTTADYTSVNYNNWNVAIATRNATTGVISIYVNGSSTASATATAPTTTLNSTSSFSMGKSTLAADDNCNCMIPFAGIWNRVLSAEERKGLYFNLKQNFASKGIVLP